MVQHYECDNQSSKEKKFLTPLLVDIKICTSSLSFSSNQFYPVIVIAKKMRLIHMLQISVGKTEI